MGFDIVGMLRQADEPQEAHVFGRLVTEHGYGVCETARNWGINATMLGRWTREFETKPSAAFPGNGRLPLDKEE